MPKKIHKVVSAFSIDKALYQWLKGLAYLERRSISGTLNMLLQYCKDEESKPKPGD